MPGWVVLQVAECACNTSADCDDFVVDTSISDDDEEDNYYDMTNKNRGIAVLFNHYEYDKEVSITLAILRE